MCREAAPKLEQMCSTRRSRLRVFVEVSETFAIHKIHNAETISLFILEACVGTDSILTSHNLLQHKSHFEKSPKVNASGEMLTS